MTVVNFTPKSELNKLRCTNCGTTTDAPCSCGVPYELLHPIQKAKIGVKETPHLSNVAIAARVGVSESTVRKVRKQGRAKNEPDKRKGTDGKIYSMPKPKANESVWTSERDAKLVQLTEQGMTDPQIAKQLNTTEGAVSGRRVRINFKNFSPTDRRMPPRMPDDVLLQALERIRIIRFPMQELDNISLYADQMHDDLKQRIAEEVEVFYNLSRDIIKRLVGGIQGIKPPGAVACGIEVKIRKED